MLYTQVPSKAERDSLYTVNGMADGQSARKAPKFVAREIAAVPVSLGQLQPPLQQQHQSKGCSWHSGLTSKVSMQCCLHS